MKRWLVLTLAASTLAFSNPAKVRMAQRQYFEGSHRYLIDYLYAADAIVRQPLELSTSKLHLKTHYEAEITVFDVTSGSRIPVGRPFAGEYTDLGCIEDAPALLVHRALSEQGRATDEDEAGQIAHPSPYTLSILPKKEPAQHPAVRN